MTKIKDFILVHRQLLAYLAMVLAILFSIGAIKNESNTRANEVERTNVISQRAIAHAGGLAVKDGCVRDKKTIKQLRDIIQRGRVTSLKLLANGTISQDTFDKFESDRIESLDDLTIPNCKESLRQFYSDIAKATVQGNIENPK